MNREWAIGFGEWQWGIDNKQWERKIPRQRGKSDNLFFDQKYSDISCFFS